MQFTTTFPIFANRNRKLGMTLLKQRAEVLALSKSFPAPSVNVGGHFALESGKMCQHFFP